MRVSRNHKVGHSRSTILSAAALATLAACVRPPLTHAATLTVDGSPGNSPYTVSASATYDEIDIGTSSGGVINQNAYTLSTGDTINVGDGAAGTFNLNGTGAVTAYSEIIGASGQGTFNQSNGSNIIGSGNNGHFYMSFNNRDNSAYTLSGGTFTVGNGGIGYASAVATFNQTGGNATINDLTIGSYTSDGTYNLSGGTLECVSIVGSTGTSVFNFNGGTLEPEIGVGGFMSD